MGSSSECTWIQPKGASDGLSPLWLGWERLGKTMGWRVKTLQRNEPRRPLVSVRSTSFPNYWAIPKQFGTSEASSICIQKVISPRGLFKRKIFTNLSGAQEYTLLKKKWASFEMVGKQAPSNHLQALLTTTHCKKYISLPDHTCTHKKPETKFCWTIFIFPMYLIYCSFLFY